MVKSFTAAIAALQPQGSGAVATGASSSTPTVIQVHMHTGGGGRQSASAGDSNRGGNEEMDGDNKEEAGDSDGMSVNDRINAAVKRAVGKIYADRAKEDRNNLERRALELEHDQSVQQ